MQVNSIIIVGGGTAGWFTAAALAKAVPDVKLTLIESKEIPSIGVGESTLGHINRFFKFLGLRDEDWMKECDATYKVSIAFKDFYKKETFFQYPFGNISQNEKRHSYYWFKLNAVYPDKVHSQDFANFINYNANLATYNRLTDIDNELYNFENDVAYHFDAEKFAKYLKNNFCTGINHYVSTVENINLNENGIESIQIDGLTLKADLYIDCTGFNSLLIEKKLKVPFVPFNFLKNDAAIAARIPYEKEPTDITNTTLCTALSSGWMWEIPLWNRFGCGYVFSQQFQDFENAEKEFRNKINYNGDVKHINFRHGYHEKAFYKNVFSVGLAYGFVEPLESTGLLTIHENIFHLLAPLIKKDHNLNAIDIHNINQNCTDMMKNFSNFIFHHYILSKRNDSEYWNYFSNKIDFSEFDSNEYSLANLTEERYYESKSSLGKNAAASGNLFIAIGMNYNGIKSFFLRDDQIKQQSKRLIEYYKLLQEDKEKMLKLPTTYEFLKEKIYF